MKYVSIAIIDDDLMARSMVKQFLKGTEYHVIAEFQAPKDAYEWLRIHDVSLVLCDMKLPQMNGVELISMIRTIHPDLPVVAISSFEDFEFTRGCIRNNVCDYLLKSNLTQAKLLSVLDDIRLHHNIREEETVNQQPDLIPRNEPFTADRLEHLIRTDRLALFPDCTIAILFSPDYPVKTGINWKEYRHDNAMTFIDIINDVLGSGIPHVIHPESDERILLILSFPRDMRDKEVILKMVNRFTEKLRRKTFRLLDLPLSLIVGEQGTLEDTMKQCDELLHTEEGKFRWQQNATVFLSRYVPSTPKTPFRANGFFDVLSFALHWWYASLAHDVVEGMFRQLGRSACSRTEFTVIAGRILSLLEVKDADAYIAQVQRMEDLQKLIDQICDEKIMKEADNARKFYPAPVFTLMEAVKRDYRQNLSLQEYAVTLECSYTYISREFKDKTGFRFVEFVNLLKVNRSKLWLLDGSVPLKQIYQKAGFESYSYFFKVFKDVERLTPTRYITKNCSLS